MTAQDNYSTKRIDAVLADPCASYWLKDALRSAMKRDCLDAAGDANMLDMLLQERLLLIQRAA